MTHENTICPYCGVDYSDPSGLASDGYMWEGHVIQDCHKIPAMAREWYNKPWVRNKLKYRIYMKLHKWWSL